MADVNQNDVVQSLTEIRELTEKGQKMTAEDRAKIETLEQIQVKHQEASDEIVKKMALTEKDNEEKTKRLEDLEAQLARAPINSVEANAQELARKSLETIGLAMKKMSHKETASFTPEEQKYLRTDTDYNGGFLVMDEYDTQLVEKLTEISAIRALASVQRVSSKRLIIPKRDALLTSYWLGENEASTASNSTYAQGSITAGKLFVEVNVTNEILEDAYLSIPQLVLGDAAEDMAQKEGSAFVSGNGVNKPFGFMANSEVSELVTGVASADFTIDNLIDLMAVPKSGYAPRSVFGMNRQTIAFVRKLKDSDGNYLWQDGSVSSGTPNMLLGAPVVEIPDMDARAIGATPVVYGDFRSAYKIIDRVGTSVVTDPFTSAGNDSTKMYIRRRVGGDVVLGEALAKLKTSAS